jgi:NDP-sugar pyrophosphorylase family protein
MKRAAILAGGLATRLRSVVSDKPKCLVEIQGRPFIDYQFAYLRRHGIREVVMLVGHLGDQIEDYLGDGKRQDMAVAYAWEDAPLGTAGALQNAKDHLDAPFVLLNGDTIFDLDLGAFMAFHQDQGKPIGSIALCAMEDISDYGSVTIDDGNTVTAFREKRADHEPGLVNAGVYCFESAMIDRIPECQRYSTETDLLPGCVEAGVRLAGYPFRGSFVDIGTPDRLDLAQGHFLFQQHPPEEDSDS